MDHEAQGASAPHILWGEPPRRIEAASATEARKWLAELDRRLRDEGLAVFADALCARADLTQFLGAVMSLSSHLRDTALLRPARARRFVVRRTRCANGGTGTPNTRRWPDGSSRGGADDRLAKRQGGNLAALRPCRSWRVVAGQFGDGGADRFRRRSACRDLRSLAAVPGRCREGDPGRPERSARGLRPHHPRHGQIRRPRAQLFQRHRPHPAFRTARNADPHR